MPCKNAEDFLAECLESVLAQTYTNWELLIVDDHSTDKSASIIQSFINRDNRIQKFVNVDVGIVSALSLAFSKSKGEYISRMDADDMMPAEKLKVLKELLGTRRKVVATSKVKYFSTAEVSEGYLAYQNWLNELKRHEDFKTNIYRECVVASPNWLVHRSCFENDLNLSELEYPEDYDMTLKWYSLAYQFVSSSETTHMWREHPQRTSRNSERYQQKSFYKLKLKHFVSNEVQDDDSVQLIGAGVKGKLTAAILKELNTDFIWFDFNKNRLVNNVLKDVQNIQPIGKTLLTNWPNEHNVRAAVIKFLEEKGFVFGENIWVL